MIMLQSFGVVNKTVAAETYFYNMLHPLHQGANVPRRAADFLARLSPPLKKRQTLSVRLDSRLT